MGRDPYARLQSVDPRTLSATQGNITRAGVRYYLGQKYENSGMTFADNDRPTNRVPMVYRRSNGENLILTGHHRAAAALLKGEPLRAIVVEEP